MANEDMELRLVTIMDAQVEEDLGTDDEPHFKISINLLLKDVETGAVLHVSLSDEDVKSLVRHPERVTSKEMIDFAEKLRARPEPLKLLVPKNNLELGIDDLIPTRNLDEKAKPKRKRRRRAKKPATSV